VKTIAASMKKIGLQNPISVMAAVDRKYTLIAGRHRYEAAVLNGDVMIRASVMSVDSTDARLWEISENLHRADLSKLERSEQIAEWVRLTIAPKKTGDDKPAQLAQVSKGGRGNKSGVAAASRELGIDRDAVNRSIKIDSITPEAKQAAIDAGLDDNQSALLRVAAAPEETQIEVVEGIVTAKASGVTKTVRKRRDGSEITIIDTSADDGPDGQFTDPIIRTNGFMFRAAESLRYAKYDDLAGLEITEDMWTAALAAADAWQNIVNGYAPEWHKRIVADPAIMTQIKAGDYSALSKQSSAA
jgi:ParB-like chromosome segregation protein Spo0J